MNIKEEVVNFCHGCLSSDRNVAPLGELSDVFYILKPQTCTYDVVLLCWECRSILKKTWKFRQRIQQVQLLLKTPEFYLNFSTSTLSTLQSTVINNNCEIVCENEKKVKLEIEEEFNDLDDKNDRNDDISNEEDIRIEPKEEIFNNIVLEEDINIEFNKINTSFEDEMYNEVKSDETIQYKTKEEIFNKEVERKKTNKRKKNIEIEIPIINESDLDDKVFDDDISDEEISNKSPEDNLQIQKKKKKITPEQRPCRYKKRELITKNTTNMERFYVINDVNEKVIEEILDRRLSIKYSGKPKNKCRLCNIMFKREIDLRRHKTLKHFPVKGPYKCCECIYFKSNNISELHEHWQRHKMYKCLLCPNASVTDVQIMRHLIQRHQYIFQCLECGKDFYTGRDIFVHYNEAHNISVCDHCGKTYKRKKRLEEHMINKHLPKKCDICGQVCKSTQALGAHKRICRPDKHFDGNAPELSYCVECNKQYESIEKYQNHLRNSALHNPPVHVCIPCPDCGKNFSRKIYMKNHYKLVHMKESKHYCEICNKYFISGYSLRTHRKSVHERKYPPKNKICDICGKGFNTNRILNNHKRTHTGEKPFQCSYCPSAFAQKTAKIYHEKKHHKDV